MRCRLIITSVHLKKKREEEEEEKSVSKYENKNRHFSRKLSIENLLLEYLTLRTISCSFFFFFLPFLPLFHFVEHSGQAQPTVLVHAMVYDRRWVVSHAAIHRSHTDDAPVH